MKIAVLSDGAWGTALAMNLIDNGHEVVSWGPFPDYLDEMREKRENVRFLPGVKLRKPCRSKPISAGPPTAPGCCCSRLRRSICAGCSTNSSRTSTRSATCCWMWPRGSKSIPGC